MRRAIVLCLVPLAGCARPMAEDVSPAGAAAAPVVAAAPVGNPAVGGATLPTNRPIADNLAAAPELGGFVRALAAAGMTDTLRAAGPFTVFAPSDAAFARLQPGTVEALMKPENRAALIRLVGLHMLPERVTGAELMRRIAAGGGTATLATVAGEPLTATMTQGIVTLTDAGGNLSYVEVADVRETNGVIHVVNGVLIPRLD